jgi:hypothetical protein
MKQPFGAKRAGSSLPSMPCIGTSHRKEGVVSYSINPSHQFAKPMVFDIWYHFAAGRSSIHEPERAGLPD